MNLYSVARVSARSIADVRVAMNCRTSAGRMLTASAHAFSLAGSTDVPRVAQLIVQEPQFNETVLQSSRFQPLTIPPIFDAIGLPFAG